MLNIRLKAIAELQSRIHIQTTNLKYGKISSYFGKNVFDKRIMKDYISASSYNDLVQVIEKGENMAESLAEAIASAMKNWALAKNVTHYAHWFQPLTGNTAEKHESFFKLNEGGQPLEIFDGSKLTKQESDASPFPSGGLRQTFEARGYTAWDPSSPAFIMESGLGKTLCIPTIFVSYMGQALDHKAPLLKSIQYLDRTATDICHIFDKNVTSVVATLGCEQEFFVIDKTLATARPDLLLCNRTLFGRPPAKGQQLNDHYFGSIPNRVQKFLLALEFEAYKLGIPIITRHNEVAPSQFEVAPTFEEANVANDHNQLLMALMHRIADAHQLLVLFHEKPFAELNGSGKHSNYSLQTNKGKNLLAPSSRAKENLQFLIFFVAIIKAIKDYAPLLRASIASAGNDERLGANEAPPPIISIFIGEQLKAVLDELDHNSNINVKRGDNLYIKLGISKIPKILLDNTDRNRTLPFAFTGDKFEFRAVGAAANAAEPLTVLNTIIADRLSQFYAQIMPDIAAGKKKEVVIINQLRVYIKDSKAIIFNGDGHSKTWLQEAKKRKLLNEKFTPNALDTLLLEKHFTVFTKHQIMSEKEIQARYEIKLNNYIRKVQIDSRVLGDLVLNHVIPAAIKYQNILIENVNGLVTLGLSEFKEEPMITIKKIASYLNALKKMVYQMIDARKKVNCYTDLKKRARAYNVEVREPYFDEIRKYTNKLEHIIDDAMWPLPKYRELLFLK